jgi:Holliday junction resolvasome RuvABC ATP-dependent DNA helicase subunit
MDATLIIAIVLAAAQMIYNGLLGLFMFGMRRKFAQHDELRTKVEQREETIRAQVDAAVDTKIGTLADSIGRIEKRLEQGEQRFARLNSQDHEAELKNAEEIHKLWLYVTQHCATRNGVEELNKMLTAMREDLVRVRAEQASGGDA